MKIGGFFDTGFAIGIKKSSDKVTEQAESVGYKAKNTRKSGSWRFC